MSGLLPSTLTASTVDDILATLEAAFYPDPSPGFGARHGVLLALTVIYMVASASYLALTVYYSKERPRWKCMWFVRLVDRPSGRFIVLNPRPCWTITTFAYGAFSLAYLVDFYIVYVKHASQEAWFPLRSLNAPMLFFPGWMISWSGLQSFLLTTESNDSTFLRAWVANALFLVGGFLTFSINLGLGISTSVLGLRFWHRFEDLRDTLVTLNTQLNGRVPSLLDLIVLQEPYARFDDAQKAWKTPSLWQYSVVTILPAAVLLVNFGGLALARKLHIQIKESVEVLALVEARRGSKSTQRGQSFSVGQTGSVPQAIVSFNGDRRASAAPGDGVETEEGGEKRKPSLTTGEVRFLAKQTDEGTRLQARKVLQLQKAKRELIAVSATVAINAVALLVDSILVANWAATDAIYKGHWHILEAAVSLPSWLIGIVACGGSLYLCYNMIVNHVLIDSAFFSRWRSRRDSFSSGAPPSNLPATSSFLSGFVDHAHSLPAHGPHGVADEHELVELRPARLGFDEESIDPLDADAPPVGFPPRKMSVVSTGSSAGESLGANGKRRGSALSIPTGGQGGGGFSGIRKPRWFSLRRHGSDSSLGGQHGTGAGGHGGGSRPHSTVGQGIVFTVETEQVCDGDTCQLWAVEEERRGPRSVLDKEDDLAEGSGTSASDRGSREDGAV
ncbi:hypothetical protein JCM10207_007042 [Rhodosporidiobolus poonsookiae]